MRNKHRIITFVAAAIVCLIVVYLILLSNEKAQEIYVDQTEKNITSMKKDFLKDTVNNLILETDRIRNAKAANFEMFTKSRYNSMQENLDNLDESAFVELFQVRFEEDVEPEMWTALLWDKNSSKILYRTSEFEGEEIRETSDIEALKARFSSHRVIENENLYGIFGVTNTYIDDLVKEEVGKLIRNRTYSNESYIWVNEVIDYQGGENYAIRRIHPGLPETEGMFLSTDMEDLKGNLPYLEELEGINRDGELFFTYFFKKPNSNEVSEKITYAKLYKDFDWIMAMGVHLDDIDGYAKELNNEVLALTNESALTVVRYSLVVLLVGFVLIFVLDRRNLSNSTKHLESQIKCDVLTKAASRRYGEKRLEEFFHEYRKSGENVVVMMFDIDDFKYINDEYGHHLGDQVLKEVVEKINTLTRSSDIIVRWGGDEFVGIFSGLKEESIMDFGEKLLEGVSEIKVATENKEIGITVSVGFSQFDEKDQVYSEVIRRADDAMYQSKKSGKNTIHAII